MRYAEISRKKQKCQDITSLTVEEFEKLVPVFEEAFQEYMKTHCLDGKERVGRGYVTYANCPLPTAADRLLFILVYIKTNNLQVIHGGLFGMSQGKANQWIQTLLSVLQAALRNLGDAPARSMEELARRLGQDVLPVVSSDEARDDKTSSDSLLDMPENADIAQDMLQDILVSASEVTNEPSNCSLHLEGGKGDISTSLPLFAMMGQKGGYSDQKTMKNRKSITVERKRLIR